MSSNTTSNDHSVLALFTEEERTQPITKLKPFKKSSKSSGSSSSAPASQNWKDRSTALKQLDENGAPTSPVLTQLDEKDIASFSTGRPLLDEPDYTVCKYCKKPVLKTAAVAHIKACLKAKADRTKKRKEEKAAAAAKEGGDGDEKAGKTGGKAVEGKKSVKKTKKEGDGTKGKKRKADDTKPPKEPKAKKKKEKQEKPLPKPKAPVDVEKQCGVQLPNGALCARSLTCKSHSMGLKRAVLGRSQPYDILLAAYQKKNQAKQQKAAINANGPPPEEIEANAIPVDSDEETELVMQAIARHKPQPLVNNFPMLVKRKSQYVRMREMMASALRPMFNGAGGHMGAGVGLENGIGVGGMGLAAAMGAPIPKQNSGQMQFQPPPLPNQSRKSSLSIV